MAGAGRTGELERWLEVLVRKWERFFAGDVHVPVPPERERLALERQLREVSRSEEGSTAEQFRLEQLLHRFNTFSQLWQRQLRAREERRTSAEQVPPDVPTPAPVSGEGDALAAVYREYVSALESQGRKAPVGLERFSEALEAQRRQLEAGGADVQGFEVVHEGEHVKVRARVRRRRDG